MDTIWLREALFAGMSANAFKLGTVLSMGWFWLRIGGCSVLYRGESMDEIDFENLLAVAEQDAGTIGPPDYVEHNSSSTYFYVVRWVNSCGYQEKSLICSAKVSIDAAGDLAQPQPNNIFAVKVKRIEGSKVELVWFYCPIEQESQPVCFKVYCDNGTGQIDYENPIATIPYIGRRFYRYQSNALNTGIYLFAIKAEDAGGVDDSSLVQLRLQLQSKSPGVIEIISVKSI